MQEIKLNKNIDIMQDNFIMGLNPRQAVFTAVGLLIGTAAYFFATKKGVSADIAVIITALCVAPFAALGFFKYHGLTFEKFVVVLIRQLVLMPQRLVSRLENVEYYKKDKHKIEIFEELEAKLNDQDS